MLQQAAQEVMLSLHLPVCLGVALFLVLGIMGKVKYVMCKVQYVKCTV